MSVEENKALVRRFYEECLNKKNVALVDELIAPDSVWHHSSGGETYGSEKWKQLAPRLFDTYSDYHVTIEDIVAEGDKVVVRFSLPYATSGAKV